MGRPLLNASVSPVGSVEMNRHDKDKMVIETPKTWCEADVDPDDDAWWTTKEIYVESFTTPAVADRGTTRQATWRLSAASASNEREKGNDEQKKTRSEFEFENLFPPRYTITEHELDAVLLDTVQDEEEEEFELAWDEEEDDNDLEDMIIDAEAGQDSAISTPTPSTPVGAARIVSLPMSVPPTPRRRTLPTSYPSTPVTPIHQNSYQSMSPIPASGSITTRSVARVRGFAVHSPRTELVL